jgi:ArsR family transcriptional regulator
MVKQTVPGAAINWKAFEKFNNEFNLLFSNLKIKNEKACC